MLLNFFLKSMIELQLELYWGLFSLNTQWKQFMKYQFNPFQIYWLIHISMTLWAAVTENQTQRAPTQGFAAYSETAKGSHGAPQWGAPAPLQSSRPQPWLYISVLPWPVSCCHIKWLHQREHFSLSLCPFRVDSLSWGPQKAAPNISLARTGFHAPKPVNHSDRQRGCHNGFETIMTKPLAQPHHHSDSLRVLLARKEKRNPAVCAAQRASRTVPILLQIFTRTPWCTALWFLNKEMQASGNPMICPSHTAGKAATLKAGLAGPRASAWPHHTSAATQQGKQGLVPVAAAPVMWGCCQNMTRASDRFLGIDATMCIISTSSKHWYVLLFQRKTLSWDDSDHPFQRRENSTRLISPYKRMPGVWRPGQVICLRWHLSDDLRAS